MPVHEAPYGRLVKDVACERLGRYRLLAPGVIGVEDADVLGSLLRPLAGELGQRAALRVVVLQHAVNRDVPPDEVAHTVAHELTDAGIAHPQLHQECRDRLLREVDTGITFRGEARLVMQLQVAVLHIAVCGPEQGYHIDSFGIVNAPDSGQLLNQVVTMLVTKCNLAIVLDVNAPLGAALDLLLNEPAVDNLTDGAKIYRDNPVALALTRPLDDDISAATLLHNCAAWPLYGQNLLRYCHIACIGYLYIINPIQK